MIKAHMIILLSILALLVILVVLVSKYAASPHRALSKPKPQTASDDAVAALRQEVDQLRVRISEIEKLLHEAA